MPFPTSFVVKNGSKAFAATSADMPTPVSDTLRNTTSWPMGISPSSGPAVRRPVLLGHEAGEIRDDLGLLPGGVVLHLAVDHVHAAAVGKGDWLTVQGLPYVARLRYGRVVIMTDADVDGAHIAALLMTFFYKEFPELVRQERLFLAQPPLYRLQASGKTVYAKDDADKDRLLKKEGRLGFWRWTSIFLGLVGTDRPNDVVDVHYTLAGKDQVATALPHEP